MGSILTLAVSAYFFIISYRVQFAYFFLIFMVPFLPKYIGFGIGGEGFALSLKRILLMILFIAFTLSFTQNSQYIYKRIFLVYQQNKILINLLLLYFILKVVSLSLNSREISLYIMLFDDFLFSIFILMLTILLMDSEEAIHNLMRILFYSYTCVLIFVLIESFVKQPLLSMFASGQMALSFDASQAFIRGGNYRAIGGFSNPIVLGNYLVALFPLVITFMYRNKYTLTVKILYLILTIYAVYSTGSRSAILMSALMIYFYLILILYKGSQFSRFIVILFNLIIVSVAFYFIFNYVSDLITSFTGRFDKITDVEERSSTVRALQYIEIYNKMHEAPFFGFGRERNFTTAFEDSLKIDNYYFWAILEVGVIGILIYLFFFYTLIKTAFDQYKLPYKNHYLLPVLISLIVLILYQVLSAVKDNHIYLYIFAGLICVMKVMQNNKIKSIKKDLI